MGRHYDRVGQRLGLTAADHGFESQPAPHIGGGRRGAEERRSGGREERVFRRHNYWLHAPHLYLRKLNEK